MRITSLCYEAFPGANATLLSLSQTTRLTRHFVLTSIQQGSRELEFFAQHLREVRPMLVIFGAWAPAYEQVLDALHPDTTAAVYWTSSVGQVDMSLEAPLFAAVLDHPRIRYKFFSQQNFALALAARQDSFYMPLTFPAPSRIPARRKNRVPIVSLFCGPNEYRRKNILNSLLALSQQKHPYILYLNGLSGSALYRQLLDGLDLPYHDMGWMPADEYRRTVAQVDIGLQVSFSEAFDYVAADHLQLGVPVLASRMVPAMHNMPAAIQRRCIVENADDPLEFAAKLDYLLAQPAARRALGDAARRRALKTNEKNIRQAKTTLLQIVETLG